MPQKVVVVCALPGSGWMRILKGCRLHHRKPTSSEPTSIWERWCWNASATRRSRRSVTLPMDLVRLANSFERPKSESTMWPSAPIKTFSGFRSR